MAAILTAIGSIATSFAGMVSDWIAIPTQTGNELLLFWIILPVFAVGIGLISRLVGAFRG